MLSTIKVDFTDLGNGKGLEPVISVVLKDSEDVRDKLLKTFFQSLGSESSWLTMKFGHGITDTESSYVTISPVRPDELKETVNIIKNRINPGIQEILKND